MTGMPVVALSTLIRADAGLVQIQNVGDAIRLAVAVVACAVLAALVNLLGRLGHARDDLVAALRAAVQLTAIGFLIVWVMQSWWATAGFVALMVVVASVTAGRRIAPQGRWWYAGLPVFLGAVPVGVGLVASGVVPLAPISVVPILGILIGNAMTATTLAGRRARDALTQRRGEFEAGLSIGLMRADAALLVARDEAALALLPGLDQTRTVGLVILPGAFVGTLLGGATPLQASAVQLLVLVGLLLVQSVATVLTLQLVVRDRLV